MSLQDYTHNDASANLINFKVIRDHSELFRAECNRLMEETKKACTRMQDDDQKRLDQRVKDIQFLKKELELQLKDIVLETDSLVTLKGRVQKALEACTEPQKVTVQCINERVQRVPQERVRDAVDRELLKERETAERVISLLQRVVQQLTEQIRLNQSSKYNLEKDLKEKFEAQSIDNLCMHMTPESNSNKNEFESPSTLPSLSVTPVQWENFSDINMAKAEQQKNNSMSLKALVESLLEQTASDLQQQIQATTLALQLNVHELQRVKGQMEEHLSKILLEYNKQQTLCEELERSIKENERCLGLAQARLSQRHKRPSKEQCFDPVQAQLHSEIKQIKVYITMLSQAVDRSQKEQKALVRCQLELQENINHKCGSLYIDEVLCTQHREPIVIHHF